MTFNICLFKVIGYFLCFTLNCFIMLFEKCMSSVYSNVATYYNIYCMLNAIELFELSMKILVKYIPPCLS
jgi:hypothetical protein